MPSSTQTAIANGDTRTIHLYHAHTHESIDATYRVNGQYDPAVLKQLNWFLRDWRRDEPTTMDPRLFDVVWEVYRSAGAGDTPVTVVSAYRSPETNAMLRRRSRAVAEHSQHMLGKAMDTTMPGMSMSQVRETGMKLQRGGVGYYPTAGTPFVHLDVGGVRSWPRMTYDQLARLFPDGKTVHLPTNGQPLARYEEARAEIAARGEIAPPSSRSTSFFAWLFGGGNGSADDEDSAEQAPARSRVAAVRGGRNGRGAVQMASIVPATGSATTTSSSGDDSGRDFFIAQAYRRNTPAAAPPAPVAQPAAPQASVAKAETNLPKGETYVAPAGAAPAATQVAALPPAQQPAQPATVEPASDAEPTAAIAPNMPLPPRRPSDLFALSNAPLPPARPVELAALGSSPAIPASATAYAGSTDMGLRRGDPIAALLDTGNAARSPDKSGAKGQRTGAVASVAPTTMPREPRAMTPISADGRARSPVVAARLDRSNFRAMTDMAGAAHVTTQSVSGPTIIGARSAARAASTHLAKSENGPTSSFGPTATDLSTTSFSSSRIQRASR